jgi:hypothetical protein
MEITRPGIMMLFGALVAAAGLALLYLRREQAESRIRLFGQEFQISTPALVVLLVGCGIFILPSVIQTPNEVVFSFHWPRPPGPEPTPIKVTGEEQEQNDRIIAANLITIGTTIKGVITTDQDRDFFKFKTSDHGLKTRVILRKVGPGGFGAAVTVYDSVEQRVGHEYEGGEDSVTLAFESNPNSYYYVKVEAGGEGSRGPYELLVKEE